MAKLVAEVHKKHPKSRCTELKACGSFFAWKICVAGFEDGFYVAAFCMENIVVAVLCGSFIVDDLCGSFVFCL